MKIINLIGKEQIESERTVMVKTTFGDAALYLKKGKNHTTCDDAVYLIESDGLLSFGALDGVSGELFADSASAAAVEGIESYLAACKQESIDSAIKNAFNQANSFVRFGATTASAVIIDRKGNFSISHVGDSSIFLISNGKAKLLVAHDSIVGPGSDLSNYAALRHVVSDVLGNPMVNIKQYPMGRLRKDDILIAATDGLTDNLYITVKDNVVKNDSGEADLMEILDGSKEPQECLEKLLSELNKRLYRLQEIKPREKERLLPKEDDIGIVIFKKR